MSVNNEDLPVMVVIGRLEGVSTGDAKSYCRDIINKYIDDPRDGLYCLRKDSGFVYYEIHSGGNGLGYLDSVLGIIKEGADEVIVPSGTRYLRIKNEDATISFQMLPENDRPPVTEGIAQKTKLIPYQKDSTAVLMTGVATWAMGVIIMIAGYGMTFFLGGVDEDSIVSYTYDRGFYEKVESIEKLRTNSPEAYVARLYYQQGSWGIDVRIVDIKDEGVREDYGPSLDIYQNSAIKIQGSVINTLGSIVEISEDSEGAHYEQ